MDKPDTAAAGATQWPPPAGGDTLNGWTLPGACAGVREFIGGEPVLREMAPATAHLWGYVARAQPDHQVVEGDRVRIFVTNRLPEHTAVHWHGQRLPNGMDGVGGITAPESRWARPSSTSSRRAGPAPSCTTRMPDEMTQMAMWA